MKNSSKTLAWIASGVVAATTAHAITDGSNPYERIIERNVFSLKPPPAPPPPEEAPKTPPPKITLQGITSILGRNQVLFKIQPTRPGEKEQSYILNEGERQDEIEVLSIDVNEGSIRFDNHGTPQTLTMDKDASMPTTVASAMPAGIPRPMPAGVPAIGRSPGVASAPGGGGVTTIGGGQPGLRQIPTRNVRTSPLGGGSSSVISQPAQLQFTPEEQEVMIEVNKRYLQQQGDDTAKLFPPTSLSEENQPAPTPGPDGGLPAPGSGFPSLPQ